MSPWWYGRAMSDRGWIILVVVVGVFVALSASVWLISPG